MPMEVDVKDFGLKSPGEPLLVKMHNAVHIGVLLFPKAHQVVLMPPSPFNPYNSPVW